MKLIEKKPLFDSKLQIDSVAEKFRVFTRRELQKNPFLPIDALLESAKNHFKKEYQKGRFLSAIVLDGKIDFVKINGDWTFVAPGVMDIIDLIYRGEKAA